MARSERMLISPRPPMACSLSLPRTDNSGSPFFEAARGNVDVVEKLSADACKMTAQVAPLERCISDLRATVASEAQRSTVVDLPAFRYPRDLN